MHTRPRRLVASVSTCDLDRGHAIAKDGLILHRDEGGLVKAARNRCRHMGGTFQTDHGCQLKCPRHGWTLDASTMRYVNPQGGLAQAELEVEASGDHQDEEALRLAAIQFFQSRIPRW